MPTRTLFAWLLLAALSIVAIAFGAPRALPLMVDGWDVSAAEAETIAREALRLFGDLPEDEYVVVEPQGLWMLERQMLEVLGIRTRAELLENRFLKELTGWEITVYPPGVPPHEWLYKARIASDGTVVRLLKNLPAEAEAGEIDEAEARRQADALLRRYGFDLDALGEPEVRIETLAHRTDLALRYPVIERLLDPRIEYGITVSFLGDQLGGFRAYRDDPAERALAAELQQQTIFVFGAAVVIVVLLLIVAIPFMKKYHHGEIGVRRSVELFVATAGCGLLATMASARVISEGTSAGLLPREQITLIVTVFTFAFIVIPSALLGALAWAVGESTLRSRWGHKLAAFDALLRGSWNNATVAGSSLRGIVLGLALVAALLWLAVPLAGLGFYPLASGLVERNLLGDWAGIVQVLWLVAKLLPALLVSCLLLPTMGLRWWRLRTGTLVAAALAWILVLPALLVLPLPGGFLTWFVGAAVPTLVFGSFDLLAALLCGLLAPALLGALPLLLAADGGMQLQGMIPLIVIATPLIGSLRYIQSTERFAYSYDDVPPHVRRIAERERQRVELETAREIQGAILPDLPSQLAGVEIAHVYQPATEVGGDFYDVLALEDGRLAVAVGDVAGHGVSSGLIMSMVKSALSVQVTFEPDVESVLIALNRMVFQSARKRMLTTLTYAVLDPVARRLVYASAGHIFPLRVTADGRVYELEAGQYPLGVRPHFEPAVHVEPLDAGDAVVLLSDGIVERTPGLSDEPFGFGRLRDSLARTAGGSAEAIVAGVLDDLERFTGHHPREDDVTLLVLKLSA